MDSTLVSRVLGAALAALAASPAVLATEVYRCGADGRVEYTDRPCDGGPPIVIDAPRGIVLAQSTPADVTRASAVARTVRIDAPPFVPPAAMPVAPGMSPRAVYELMGRPRDMNVSLEGITPTERWRYRTQDANVTVTFRHGRVALVTTH